MKRKVLFVFCLIILLCVTSIFFACQEESKIVLVIEGEATRGAVCKIYADVINIDDYADIKFSIVENYDWVTISGENLLFSKNAEVGASVTVCVQLGAYRDEKKITVKPTKVDSISIDELPHMQAGGEYEITYQVFPDYATDAEVIFEVVEGKELAYFQGSILHLKETCDYSDNIAIRCVSGEVSSEIKPLYISTVQPKSLEIEVEKNELKRGEQTKITCRVTPSNCTLGNAELIVPTSEYYDYVCIANQGIITIKDTAPEGEIEIQAKLGNLCETIKIQIVKTPVERIDFTSNHANILHYGDVVELKASTSPINATYNEVSVYILEGEDYVKFDKDKLTFEVTSREISKLIVFVAEADGVRANLSFITEKIKAQDILLSVDGGVSVTNGEEREIKATVIPSELAKEEVVFEITVGQEYASLQGNKITFLSISPEGKTEIKVKAKIDDIEKEIVFYIVPIPVQSVSISTADKTSELTSGEVVSFKGAVTPKNATYASLIYYIESGERYGFIRGNEFVVNEGVGSGQVVIYAQSQDGIKSNKITLEIRGSLEIISPASWNSLNKNPNLFDGLNSVKLDLTRLPLDADYTTVIISDDVDYLELYGGYDGEDYIIKNLHFYFLTSDSLNVKIENLGIVADGGFNDFVLDFGNYARINLEIVGNNYIQASSTYMANSSAFKVEGEISGASNDYLRKRGMDGFPGLNGGTCINAYDLEIAGSGEMILVAGSGSNGTDATNGANSNESTFAGHGGNGGYGGDSGYAIFANSLMLNVKGELILIGGNGGIGGKGGLGGKSVNSGYDGANGENGEDGKALDPIFVVADFLALTNNYSKRMGTTQSNSRIRNLDTSDYIELIEKYYNISTHYNSTYMPHTQYSVKALTSVNEANNMMRALDYSLSTFPKNLYLEIMQKTKSKINIYLTSSITRKLTNGVIYGLTSTVNNVWFANFDTTLRGVYYSTPFNIMTHELLHVLTFALDDKTDESLKTNLPKYNLGLTYKTNSQGVYDPEKGYNGDNSVFLCAYSKSNYSEDISDNLSMIGMLARKADYLESGKPFNEKVKYITSVYVSYFDNLTPYTLLSWKKFL